MPNPTKTELKLSPLNGASRSRKLLGIFQLEYIGPLILIFFIIFSVAATLLFPPEYVVVMVFALVGGMIIIARPTVGLILFIILNYIRPGDIVSALNAVPLAKLIGGGTFLAVVLNKLRTKDFVYRYKQTYLLTAFALILFASVPFSFWPSRSLEISLDFLKILLFYFIFINIVGDWKTLKAVSLISLCCVLVLSASTLQSYFQGNIRAAAIIGSGLFGDSNDVALVMVSVLPLVGFIKLSNIRKSLRAIYYWGSVILLIAGIIATQSRGGLLGLGVVLFMMFFHRGNKIKGLLLLGSLAVLVIALIPSNIEQRYRTIGNYQEDTSAVNRLYAWQAGLDMIISRPLRGVGVGSFETAFGTAYKPKGFNSNRWMAPHNSLVQIGAETGLFGLLLFIYLFIYSLSRLKKINQKRDGELFFRINATGDILMASFIGFAICAFFLTQALNYYLYFLIAATVSLARISETADEL